MCVSCLFVASSVCLFLLKYDHMYVFLFSEHVSISADPLSALHVSQCSSLGIRAHLDSAIVMATLELNFSGQLCLFQSPVPPSHLENNVDFFVCSCIDECWECWCARLCARALKLYISNIYTHLYMCDEALYRWRSKLLWPVHGPTAACHCLESPIKVVFLQQ